MTKITKPDDMLLKIIIIGDSGVGKSNILMRFCDSSFKTNHVATIGVDFKTKSVQIDDMKLKFQIWDTAGQERYRTITQAYYKGASGIILAYSVADQRSFANIENWMAQIREHTDPSVQKILIGNKCDVDADERRVQYLEGKVLADRHEIDFLECSAKSGENIQEIFTKLGRKILSDARNNPTKYEHAKLITPQPNKTSKKNCC